MDRYILTSEQITKIDEILTKGDRIELIPLKDRIKVIHIRRNEVKFRSPAKAEPKDK